MTLRDVGDWLSGIWTSMADGFHIAANESFWDWPLWLSIPVGLFVPWLILWLVSNHIHETRGKTASFWESLGFSTGTFVCAYATYDVWFGGWIFDQDQRALGLMKIGYPIMATLFGLAGLHGFASRRKRSQDDED